MKHRKTAGIAVQSFIGVLALFSHRSFSAVPDLFPLRVPALPTKEAIRLITSQSRVGFTIEDSDVARHPLGPLVGPYNEQTLISTLRKQGLAIELLSPHFYKICRYADCRATNSPEAATLSSESTSGPEVITISASRSANADIERTESDSQPRAIFSADEVSRSLSPDVSGFMRQRLPANQAVTGTAEGGFLGGPTMLNLRGRGTGRTLVLRNGKRVAGIFAGGAELQWDTAMIPVEALKAIQVLSVPASAIYGGGSDGGVVNLIVDRDTEGIDMSALLATNDRGETDTRRLFARVGQTFLNDKLRVHAFGSYWRQEAVEMEDLDLISRGRGHIEANNRGVLSDATVPPLGETTNFRSMTGEALYGPGTSNKGTVPRGTGSASIESLRQGAGHYNLAAADSTQARGGKHAGIGSATESRMFDSILTYEVNDAMRVSAAFARAWIDRSLAGSGADSSATALGAILPADAPTNDFGIPLRVSIPLSNANDLITNQVTATDGSLTLDFHPASLWDGTMDLSRSLNVLSYERLELADIRPLIADGTLDVLSDPIDASSLNHLRNTFTGDSLQSGIQSASLRIGRKRERRSKIYVFNMQVENRHEWLGPGSERLTADANGRLLSQSELQRQSRDIVSAYAEVRAPILSNTARPDKPRLELHASLRTDRYRFRTRSLRLPMDAASPPTAEARTRFESTNWMLSLTGRPTSSLEVRASASTAFVAPTLIQVTPATEQPFPEGAFADPERQNEATPALVVMAGGNPALKPETSHSWSTGVLFRPQSMPQLHAALDYTVGREADGIESPATRFFLDPPASLREDAGLAIRGTPDPDNPSLPAPIVAIDLTNRNSLRAKFDAWDLTVGYEGRPVGQGLLSFNMRASYQPNARTSHGLNEGSLNNTLSSPPLRASSELLFETGRWALSWQQLYISRYKVADTPLTIANQGGPSVSSQQYHDLLAGYTWPVGGGDRQLQLRVGWRNVLHQRPPFDAGSPLLGNSSPFGEFRRPTVTLSVSLIPVRATG